MATGVPHWVHEPAWQQRSIRIVMLSAVGLSVQQPSSASNEYKTTGSALHGRSRESS